MQMKWSTTVTRTWSRKTWCRIVSNFCQQLDRRRINSVLVIPKSMNRDEMKDDVSDMLVRRANRLRLRTARLSGRYVRSSVAKWTDRTGAFNLHPLIPLTPWLCSIPLTLRAAALSAQFNNRSREPAGFSSVMALPQGRLRECLKPSRTTSRLLAGVEWPAATGCSSWSVDGCGENLDTSWT